MLYVDVDGVLHHDGVLWDPRRGVHMSEVLAPGHQLFEWAHHLESALEGHPDVALVLSSTWCIRLGYASTLRYLTPSLRSRFIGATYHRKVHGSDPWTKNDFMKTARGVQVCADVSRRRPQFWAALDDDAEGWPDDAVEHLIRCEGSRGLSDDLVLERLQVWLNAHR